jgi:hypothetical protein
MARDLDYTTVMQIVIVWFLQNFVVQCLKIIVVIKFEEICIEV